MKRNTALSLGLVAAIAMGAAISTPLFAGSDHGQQTGKVQQGAMMGNQGGMMGGKSGMMGGQQGHQGGQQGHQGMMQMMMKMHSQMMGGGQGMMGGGMMGGGKMGGMGYLKGMDADGDGTVSPDEMRAGLDAKLKDFDANGDGTLSIEEFEALHSAAIRDKMVDRFQMLDSDGDGMVTADEMAAPADRMAKMMAKRQAAMGTGGGMGMGAGNGNMMQNQDN